MSRHSMALYFRRPSVIVLQGPRQPKASTSVQQQFLRPLEPTDVVYTSLPSSFGKQFGPARMILQKREIQSGLLVKHSANNMSYSHPEASIAPPTMAIGHRHVSSPSSPGPESNLSCPVGRMQLGILPASQPHDSPYFQSNSRRLQHSCCSFLCPRRQVPSTQPLPVQAATLIKHMHANPALSTSWYSPRKLQPFQGVKEIARLGSCDLGPPPNHWTCMPTGSPPELYYKRDPYSSYQVTFSIVSKNQTSRSRLRNNITDTPQPAPLSPRGRLVVRDSFSSPPREVATIVSGTVSRHRTLYTMAPAS